MKRTNKAFTLVEILVVCGVSALFLAIAISVFSNFRQGYSHSESGAILLQDAALFLAQLRSDMNNAVIDPDLPAEQSQNQFNTEPGQLRFKIYDNHEGKILPVVYTISSRDLTRRVGAGSARHLIRGNVASISWQSEIESFAGKASGTIRLGLKLSVNLATEKEKNRHFVVSAKVFPSRLNRQMNSR